MKLRNLRNVPVLLRYAGYRKISIPRLGLSESLPVSLARSHNLSRDVARRLVDIVYEEGEVSPQEQRKVAKAAIAAKPVTERIRPEPRPRPDTSPEKVDLIAERMLERLRLIKAESAPSELARLRRMADMNPMMAPTVARVLEAYGRQSAQPVPDTVTASPGSSTASLDSETTHTETTTWQSNPPSTAG